MPADSVAKARCAVCGGPMPSDAAESVCPRCALSGALELQPADRGQKSEVGGQKSEVGEQRSEVEGQQSEVGGHSPGGDAASAKRKAQNENDFGDYELLEKLGEGGMGVVFRARQKSLNRLVAIKMLRLGPHAAPEFVKRFRAEAVAAASLQHPHIVAIHEVGSLQGQQFFVMDYVEGHSPARLVGNQPLPARQAARYVCAIAEAVHYAHERGLLHRDLKPANVLVDAQDQVRVMDFGLARRLEGDSELTLTGQVLGSPQYMPPEQAAGKRGRVGRHTDVYGLGAILYHLLTGRPPFLGEGLPELLQDVLSREPVSPGLLNPGVPRDLETVCLKCLEKEPSRRYPSASAVADELGRYLEDQPIQARPVTRAERVWRWCRRQPVRAALTAGLLLVFFLGALGVLLEWRRARAGELRATQLAYVSDMGLAFQAVEAEDRGRALDLLNRYWPAGESASRNPPSALDLRQWEWRHLWRRCESDAVLTLTNYEYLIAGLAVSANGRWLAVCTASNICIWDLVTRQPRDRVPVCAAVPAVDVSHDGRLVACAEVDMTGRAGTMVKDFAAVVYDTTTRTIVARLPHPGATHWLSQVALSPDARLLATLDWEEHTGFVRLWNLQTKECLYATSVSPGNTMRTRELHFSPDGQLLAVGQSDGIVRILNAVTGEVRRDIPPPGRDSSVTALAFSPDGKQLAAGYGRNGNVDLWRTQTGEPAGQLVGHRKQTGALCFLPGGQQLASASDDGTVRLWDVPARKEIRRFYGHAGEVYALAALPDGQTLVSGGLDHCVCLWHTDHRKTGCTTAELPARARDFVFTPDNRHVLAADNAGGIKVWEAATLQPVALDWPGLATNSQCLAVASRAEHTWLATGTADGGVQVWDITSLAAPQRVAAFKAHDAPVVMLKFDPRGQTLMSSTLRPLAWGDSRPENFKAWDTSSWRERPEFRVRSHQVAYLPDAHLMVVRRAPIGMNFAVRDLRTGQERLIATGHRHAMANLVFSPDGRWLASGCHEGTAKLWEVGSWRCAATLPGTGPPAVDMAFSPDGQRLVVASGPVRLWDLATHHELATLALDATDGNGAAVAFSPDGNTLAVRDRAGTLHFWRAPPLAEIESAARRSGH